MGTLTTDCPRLDEHCPHKLATSCRLTSTPNCCACADDRPHSLAYRIYIDGVGFVNHGTRWQNYCWYCKEFWNNRIASTDPPVTPAQTRIPEHPDQTAFLRKWSEFHRGYSVADGVRVSRTESFEPLREVAPGFLPRSHAELRRGVPNDARRFFNRFQAETLASNTETEEGPHQSIEDALDELMRDEDEEEREGRGQGQEGAIPGVQAGNWISEHDSIESTRAGTQGSEEQDPSADTQSEAQRLEQEPQPQALASVESPSGPGRGRRRETHQQRLARVLGTREDVQRDDYVSPIANMYTRAWGRYQQAEQARASEPMIPPLPQSPQPQQDPTAAFAAALQEISEAENAREADDRSSPETDDILHQAQLDLELRGSQEHLLRIASALNTPIQPAHGPRLSPLSAAARAHDRALFTHRVRSTLEEMLRQRTLHLRRTARDAGPSAVSDPELAFLDTTDDSIVATMARLQTQVAEWQQRAHQYRQDMAAAGDHPQRQADALAALGRGSQRRVDGSAALDDFAQERDDIVRFSQEVQRYRAEIERSRSWLANMNSYLANAPTPAQLTERLAAATAPVPVPAPVPDPPSNPLDSPSRPAPSSEADMTRTLRCKVCYEQVASTALLPCGHVVLCQWCAETVVPMRHPHVPVAGTKCPLCRGVVKQVWKVHL